MSCHCILCNNLIMIYLYTYTAAKLLPRATCHWLAAELIATTSRKRACCFSSLGCSGVHTRGGGQKVVGGKITAAAAAAADAAAASELLSWPIALSDFYRCSDELQSPAWLHFGLSSAMFTSAKAKMNYRPAVGHSCLIIAALLVQ